MLHARMMELLLRSTPDGAAVLVRDDYVCVWRDGPFCTAPTCLHDALALAVADLLPSYLLRDDLTVEAAALMGDGFAGCATDSSRSGPTCLSCAGSALASTNPTRSFRSGCPAASKTSSLTSTPCTTRPPRSSRSSPGGRPGRFLVTVGLVSRGRAAVWCDDLDDVLESAQLDQLCGELRLVPVDVAVEDPVVFSMSVSVGLPDATLEDYPELPASWAAAAAAAGRPLAIPDELFDWMWPRPVEAEAEAEA